MVAPILQVPRMYGDGEHQVNRDRRFRRHRQDGTNLVLSDMMEMTTSKPTDNSSNNPQIASISNGYAALTKQTSGALFPRTE